MRTSVGNFCTVYGTFVRPFLEYSQIGLFVDRKAPEIEHSVANKTISGLIHLPSLWRLLKLSFYSSDMTRTHRELFLMHHPFTLIHVDENFDPHPPSSLGDTPESFSREVSGNNETQLLYQQGGILKKRTRWRNRDVG